MAITLKDAAARWKSVYSPKHQVLREEETALNCTMGGWDIRKKIFPEKAVKCWNRLPREVVRSLLLEVLKRPVIVELNDIF